MRAAAGEAEAARAALEAELAQVCAVCAVWRFQTLQRAWAGGRPICNAFHALAYPCRPEEPVMIQQGTRLQW